MESVVQIEIGSPLSRVATLFADPRIAPKWMRDIKGVERISGDVGMPGSKYRLVPTEGNLEFVATVISRNLPREVSILLDHPTVSVSVTGTFAAVSPQRTLLTSREIFRFKGVNWVFGLFARRAIDKVHREQMENFKRYAEENA